MHSQVSPPDGSIFHRMILWGLVGMLSHFCPLCRSISKTTERFCRECQQCILSSVQVITIISNIIFENLAIHSHVSSPGGSIFHQSTSLEILARHSHICPPAGSTLPLNGFIQNAGNGFSCMAPRWQHDLTSEFVRDAGNGFQGLSTRWEHFFQNCSYWETW